MVVERPQRGAAVAPGRVALMALVETDSRSKIAIEWYDDESEALARVDAVTAQAIARVAEGYDFGYASIGRDPGFDKTAPDGTRLYAVVTP